MKTLFAADSTQNVDREIKLT